MAEYVTVIGLGYVGLPVAVSLAGAGVRVAGVDTNPVVRNAVQARQAPFFEPGLTEALRALPEGMLTVAAAPPATRPPRAIVICVGTPTDPDTLQPDLTHLQAAVDVGASHMGDNTLVVVRSTVPVGTCRQLVLPRLRAQVANPMLAFCPERLIQGTALAEIRSLPQIVGPLDERSLAAADDLHATLTDKRVSVSSLETAEMIKLVGNAHTDLIYGFGNEVALMATALGLDAGEVIRSANTGYPRPDISLPGYVGGSCLTKDPYLLMYSASSAGYSPPMVAAARQLNEEVPVLAVGRFTRQLAELSNRPFTESKILVCGMAYKGRPETDDVRGAASTTVARLLGGNVKTLAGHDFLVPDHVVRGLGFEPAGLEGGLHDADGALLLVDHPRYRDITADQVRALMRGPRLILDMWGIAEDALADEDGITYVRYGRG
ncbi:nucleotide sugar dehydrogenase [Actinocrispum wychmicini]|uniref:UDP-N-acetyl-D-mannosaminuronic acid dehydrogenase n=1 Tax=Actinocrispum wychmicini TaxID=1213861 RepID=A0A4R2JSN1_9PSEU|nr:nucleotide sugar dehydrogenase [Actinocrispum wychmicini]TCO61932.1 UDP-N-acetyl-D-mannosaminuronic acid dehydrogenase [Actinocrispum wychmicini]